MFKGNLLTNFTFLCALFFLLTVSFLDARKEKNLLRFEFRKLLMGVVARIVVYAPNDYIAKWACSRAFLRIAQLDELMSDYRNDSELMRVCRNGHLSPLQVSKDLFFVLERALELSRRSNGAFDVTVGPFVSLWRRARQTKQLPTEHELNEAKKLVGWEKIQLDASKGTVKLAIAGMKLDLGGIAKGYAADCALKVLQKFGLRHALIELGGDIVLGEPPPNRKGWRIGILNENGKPEKVLELANCAISTSGSTEQYVEIDGKRYAHIVDPRTGLGLTKLVLVTVIAKDGITADSLATALCVLGEKEGHKLAKAYGAMAFFRERKN
ncbi:MAG: FAD:protein FMN transferase [Armatimonadetes bacterium]|nr:FAD:protein FMN transferase [Armatimonadota bacterium]MDW8028953.1 FAD:protein FMN transferase [Armatimonadota bacterium]